MAEAAASHDGISPARIILCLGPLEYVTPLKYLKWGDCIIELKLLCICRIGPSGPVAVNHFGLLQAVGSSVHTLALVWPWRFYLTLSEIDVVVMLNRRRVCRIAALFPGVLPPFPALWKGLGVGLVWWILSVVDPLLVDLFLLVF